MKLKDSYRKVERLENQIQDASISSPLKNASIGSEGESENLGLREKNTELQRQIFEIKNENEKLKSMI